MTTEQKASWVTAKPEDVKAKIIDLAKQGMTSEKIGLILRDQHGIPKAKVLGLKIKDVLKEADCWKDGESEMREKGLEITTKHVAAHKHDYKAIRSLTRRSAHHARLKKK